MTFVFDKVRFQKRALRTAVGLKSPALAARLLSIVSSPDGIVSPPTSKRPYRALVLNAGKGDFLQDVQEVFRNDQKFELITWPSWGLRIIAEAFFKDPIKHDTYITNDPTIEAAKAAYRNFLLKAWRHFNRIKPTNIVISANFGYSVQRELATALETLGTPFVVLQKENLNASTPARRKIWESIYRHGRGKFTGRKILVYNNLERDLQLSSGIAEPSQVVVAGMPRLDRFHAWRQQNAERQITPSVCDVLFFAFSRTDKIPETHKGLDWGKFCDQTHRAMLEFAKERPNLRVTVKTKGITRQDTELANLLGAAGDQFPDNFKIVSGGDPFRLVTGSRVVVGFNTTGLLEALALGKTVVVPQFAEAEDETLREFTYDLGASVTYAGSGDELKQILDQKLMHAGQIPATLTDNVRSSLEKWLGNSDGNAAQRAIDVIYAEACRSTVK